MFIPPGIINSGTKNPPEEWDSAKNYQLIDEESTQGKAFYRELPAHYADSGRYDQNARKVLRTVTIPGSAAPNPIYWQCQLKKFKYEDLIKMKKNLKINLIRPY
jgi:hypothetical protein